MMNIDFDNLLNSIQSNYLKAEKTKNRKLMNATLKRSQIMTNLIEAYIKMCVFEFNNNTSKIVSETNSKDIGGNNGR